MPVCTACGAERSRDELVDEVFRVDERYVLVGRYSRSRLRPLWRTVVQPRNDRPGPADAAWTRRTDSLHSAGDLRIHP